ncbi:MAG TPA: Na+/H+ antiporter subunit C, partial [Paracoccaceae bacterium]|nr:Na+/H+ antiporter subunit C [Paracoccaceae bacterium]
LVLTAIVISFGMTAVIVMIALGAYLGSSDDHVDDLPAKEARDKRKAEEDAA